MLWAKICEFYSSPTVPELTQLPSAWWINDRPRPPTPSIFETFGNVTPSTTSNKTANATVTYYPVWRSLSSDIFTGQIIASLIVLAFLGIFLLREWILQNARPNKCNGVLYTNDFFNARRTAPVFLNTPKRLDRTG